jgi:hypothetical protein
MPDNHPDPPTGYIHLLENPPEEVFKAFLFDLVSPLASIEGYTGLLADGITDKEESPISNERIIELLGENAKTIRLHLEAALFYLKKRAEMKRSQGE